jgi:citronellol/citronellal dehydrogenase
MTQQFGKTDDELATMPLTFRDGLFAGQVVLVSGAGRGIGKAIAFQFARLGAKLALCGRDAARLDAVAAALSGLGAEVLVHPMSIRDSDAVVRLFDAAGERFGTVDVLVNNAGGQFPQAAIDFSAKGWNAVIDTNLNGTWYMMQQAARRWRDAGRGGRIVNIVAVTSRGMPGVAHTCAARAGVVYLSKTVAIEWAPLGIQINCVAPGAIATEGMNVYSEEARGTLPNTNLMRRFGDVRDIADAVCYLAGPSGAFITGEVLVVDGGNQIWGDQWTIPRPDWFNTVT